MHCALCTLIVNRNVLNLKHDKIDLVAEGIDRASSKTIQIICMQRCICKDHGNNWILIYSFNVSCYNGNRENQNKKKKFQHQKKFSPRSNKICKIIWKWQLQFRIVANGHFDCKRVTWSTNGNRANKCLLFKIRVVLTTGNIAMINRCLNKVAEKLGLWFNSHSYLLF